jgi:Uma2 family endonuclease
MVGELIAFLIPLLRERGRGTVRAGINVFDDSSPAENYRIPDLTFVAAGREHLLVEDGVRGGGPDAVIEVRSPGDESYEKLPFFAALGVREVLVIDRDTKAVEVFRLESGAYARTGTEADSVTLGIHLRTVGATRPRLVIGDAADTSRSVEI